MFNKLAHTAKHTIIYSIGNLSAKLVGFILLPLYTEYLTTGEYGIFALLEITGTIIVAVFSFKLSTGMMRWCSGKKSNEFIKSIFFTTYISALFIIVFLNLTLQLFTEDFSILFFGHTNYSDYFIILLISVSFEILNLFPFDLIRLKEKPALFVTLSLIRIITILSFNIYFIKYLQMGVKGIILSQLIGNLLVHLFSLPIIIKNMIFSFYWGELMKIFKYSIPLVFSTISMMVLTMGDRYLIKYYLNFSEVGIYSLGFKIASVINLLIVQSFQTGFLPVAYKNYNKPDYNRFFSKTLTYYAFILVFCSLGLSLFSKEIIDFFSKNKEYINAYKIVPYIAMAFIFKGIQYIYSLGLHFVKKTYYNATIIFIMALLNLLLNILFIPWFGIKGAAISTIISWIIMSFLFYKYSTKFYKVNYELRKIYLLVIMASLLYVLSQVTTIENTIFYLGLKMLILVSFPFLLYLFNFYEKVEIQYIKTFLFKVSGRKNH